jgi:hypothetical protein
MATERLSKLASVAPEQSSAQVLQLDDGNLDHESIDNPEVDNDALAQLDGVLEWMNVLHYM